MSAAPWETSDDAVDAYHDAIEEAQRADIAARSREPHGGSLWPPPDDELYLPTEEEALALRDPRKSVADSLEEKPAEEPSYLANHHPVRDFF